MKPPDGAAPIMVAITSNTRRLASCSAVKRPTNPAKMNTNPKKEESDKQKAEDVEIKIIPEGTFAGTKDRS